MKTSLIFRKTSSGVAEFRNRSMPLSHQQRLVLIVADGKRTVGDILKMTADVGAGASDIDQLAYFGLVAVCGDAAARAPAKSSRPDAGEFQRRFQVAYPLAVSLTGSLGLAGFKLNLAVERAANYGELLEVAKRVRNAVGARRFQPLKEALTGQKGGMAASPPIHVE